MHYNSPKPLCTYGNGRNKKFIFQMNKLHEALDRNLLIDEKIIELLDLALKNINVAEDLIEDKPFLELCCISRCQDILIRLQQQKDKYSFFLQFIRKPVINKE